VRISRVEIKKHIRIKIFEKHEIKVNEVVNTLLYEHVAFRVGQQRYMAIGHYERYVTIIYDLHYNTAFVITAYKTTKSQLKRYKRWLNYTKK
jgi:uncharacterized DUF497 family protein